MRSNAVIQRQNKKVDVGDFSVSTRYLVMQDALVVKPAATRYFAHHHQVVGRSISVGRVSDQLAEKQDVSGIEIPISQVIYDSGGFGRGI